jgi:ribosome-binding protein aMBF1 (putative translation factor)
MPLTSANVMWLDDAAMNTNPLKAWRDRQNPKISQEKLAEMLGVKAMTVSRWERGGHLPNKKHWPEIEKATGIAPSELVKHVKTPEAAA